METITHKMTGIVVNRFDSYDFDGVRHHYLEGWGKGGAISGWFTDEEMGELFLIGEEGVQ